MTAAPSSLSRAAQVGFQTYLWEELAHRTRGPLPSFELILDAVARAGYAAVETSTRVLQGLVDEPSVVARQLSAAGVALAGVSVSSPTGWTAPGDRVGDLELVGRVARLIGEACPDARLGIGGGRVLGGSTEVDAFNVMLGRYAEIAEHTAAVGVQAYVHPTSGVGSIVRTAADYARLLDGIADLPLTLGLDTGHLTVGGGDPPSFIANHFERIGHVHLKDARRGEGFVLLGTGDARIDACVALLAARDYRWWLIAEEESPAGVEDTEAALAHCRRYLARRGW